MRSYGDSDRGTIIAKPLLNPGGYNYVIRMDSAMPNKIYFTGPEDCISGTIPNFLNKWHHFEVTRDYSKISIYIDGILSSSVASSCPDNYINTLDYLIIGAIRSYGTYGFDGLIDDVCIYNYALTQEQIKQIMNEGSAIRFGE